MALYLSKTNVSVVNVMQIQKVFMMKLASLAVEEMK
jgi:hypothetical protein